MANELIEFEKEVGVRPPVTGTLDPRQGRFIDLYFNAGSAKFPQA